jgi:hypothetical protein
MGNETGQEADSQTREGPTMGEEDVLLDVPQLHVDSLELEVSDLRARVSLQADVLSLLRLNVGVEADLGDVRLDLRGVDVQALLKVRLENVSAILGRVMQTIESHPEMVEPLVRATEEALRASGLAAGEAIDQVGSGAREALDQVGSSATDRLGQAAQDVGRALAQVAQGRQGHGGQQQHDIEASTTADIESWHRDYRGQWRPGAGGERRFGGVRRRSGRRWR